MHKRKDVNGFTMIELIVAIAVLGILAALAGPTFTYVINSNRLTSNANELLSTLQSARMEAVRRNARVVFCRNDAPDTGTTCSTTAGAWPGWMSFVDDGAGGGTARNGIREGGEQVLFTGGFTPPLQLQASPAISGGNQRLRFSPDGLAYSDAGALLNAQFAFCIPTTAPADNTRLISVDTGARMGIQRFNGGGLCAVPAD